MALQAQLSPVGAPVLVAVLELPEQLSVYNAAIAAAVGGVGIALKHKFKLS